jgi:hypothetical protein
MAIEIMIKSISLFRYVLIPKHLSIALPKAKKVKQHEIALITVAFPDNRNVSQKNPANIKA